MSKKYMTEEEVIALTAELDLMDNPFTVNGHIKHLAKTYAEDEALKELHDQCVLRRSVLSVEVMRRRLRRGEGGAPLTDEERYKLTQWILEGLPSRVGEEGSHEEQK